MQKNYKKVIHKATHYSVPNSEKWHLPLHGETIEVYLTETGDVVKEEGVVIGGNKFPIINTRLGFDGTVMVIIINNRFFGGEVHIDTDIPVRI